MATYSELALGMPPSRQSEKKVKKNIRDFFFMATQSELALGMPHSRQPEKKVKKTF